MRCLGNREYCEISLNSVYSSRLLLNIARDIKLDIQSRAFAFLLDQIRPFAIIAVLYSARPDMENPMPLS
jgi:hypothetical protein